MRSLLILVVVLLSACQSEFENCMETELPRAQQGLSDVINQIKRYESFAQTYLQLTEGYFLYYRDEDKYHKGPAFPLLVCDSDFESDACLAARDEWDIERSAWLKTKEAEQWFESERQREVTSMLEAGVPLPQDATERDLEEFIGDFWPKHKELFSALAKTTRFSEPDCHFDGFCEDTFATELLDEFSDFPELYSGIKSLASQVFREWFDEMNADVQNQIYETAKLACNRGGIYE